MKQVKLNTRIPLELRKRLKVKAARETKIMKSFTFKSNLVRKSFTTEADCAQDAASQAKNHFLGVVARREFGRKGFCRVSKWICDGRVEAFIGTPAQGGGCSGRSIVLDVDLVD